MSAISSWLLSIACVVVLGVLAELILPEGQMNKYVKIVFSFVTLLAIIAPIPQILGSDFELSSYLSGSSTSLQEDYLYQLNIDKLNVLSADISDKIRDCGLEGVQISISANVLCESLQINGVYVDLSDLQYSQDFETKTTAYAKSAIKSIIESFFSDVEIEFSQ